ncbi:hypothetical protein MAR_015580 [Mya arenaria]|uniref:Uncharacterized protein n=1 Tax=Mya arenaria TaxID=6604 RepID=A0ABY7FLK1_MYAAR|nr:hypothetical protein MAR_015580 [Mya arenaria]
MPFLKLRTSLKKMTTNRSRSMILLPGLKTISKAQNFQAYGYTYMKSILKEHFGNRIIQIEINGKTNVLIFRSTAKAILNDFHANRKADPETEKKRIIETAAKLIKDDINSVETSHDVYPDCDTLKSEEDAINFFRKASGFYLKGDPTKSYSGTTANWVRNPGSPPLFITLFGRYSSPAWVLLLLQRGADFLSNAVVSHTTGIHGFSGEFIQKAADNVDHNIRTLDGNNTYHGMGMIASVTPATKSTNPILRANVTPHDISMAGKVPILFHKE